MSNEQNPRLLIEVDGGVGDKNAGLLVHAGANVLVAGNSVFSSVDPLAAITNLKTGPLAISLIQAFY